jgi:hypothetical protein
MFSSSLRRRKKGLSVLTEVYLLICTRHFRKFKFIIARKEAGKRVWGKERGTRVLGRTDSCIKLEILTTGLNRYTDRLL